jgi:general stress protein 26
MNKIVFQTEIEEKAVKLLEQCKTIRLASITEKGYPRICEMEKVKADNFLEMYFTAAANSNKVRHFSKNEKAGAGYGVGNACVSLMGKIEIIEDENVKKEIWKGKHEKRFDKDENGNAMFRLLKFTTVEALFFIDGQSITCEY